MHTTPVKNSKIRSTKRHSSRVPLPLALQILLLLSLCLPLSACAPSSGIFSGGNWQLSGLQHQHIHVLEVGFNNSQLLFAGDTQNGVFVSTDSGQHWTSRSTGLPLPNVIYALSFDTTGKKLYAASEKGVFVSTDAAQHWSPVGTGETATPGLPADSYTALAFDTTAPHPIYVGTTHHGVLLSTNDGTTWSAASNGLPVGDTINNLTFDPDQHQLWAATTLGIYRSDDKGTTWHTFNNGLPVNIVVNTVQVALTSGGVKGLIFAGTNHGFYRSQDSGAHWTTSQEFLAGTTIHSILVDFHSATTLYVGTDVGALRSDDSGRNWRGIGAGLPRGQPVYALKLGASNYSQLYAAANAVYLFPGTSGGISPTRLIPILLVFLMFYLLYRTAQRGRNRRREVLKPERIIESSPPAKMNGNDPSRLSDLT